MKYSKTILYSAVTVFLFCIMLLVGCKKDSGANCSDGIKNQDETGVDCGGSCAAICPCSYGYEGLNCTTAIRDKFIGGYTGSEHCNSDSADYVLSIAPSAGDIGQVVITSLHKQVTNVLASVNGTTFDVPLQFISGSTTVIGSGSLNGNNLNFNYTLTTGSSHNTCVFIGTK